jgi:hypothetical protein
MGENKSLNSTMIYIAIQKGYTFQGSRDKKYCNFCTIFPHYSSRLFPKPWQLFEWWKPKAKNDNERHE